MKSYPVIIEQDGTGYVVTCPIFKGCYSQGDTIDEALKNIKEAIELCIDDEENPVGSIIVGNVVLGKMTSKLPVVSGVDCIKALEKLGYVVVRQKGSHIRLKDRKGKLPPITVPNHKELRLGLLRKILNDAGLTVEDFIRYYRV